MKTTLQGMLAAAGVKSLNGASAQTIDMALDHLPSTLERLNRLVSRTYRPLSVIADDITQLVEQAVLRYDTNGFFSNPATLKVFSGEHGYVVRVTTSIPVYCDVASLPAGVLEHAHVVEDAGKTISLLHLTEKRSPLQLPKLYAPVDVGEYARIH